MCSCFTLFISKGLQSHRKVLASVLYLCFAPKEPLQYQECFCTSYANGSGEMKGTVVAFQFNTVTFKIFNIKNMKSKVKQEYSYYLTVLVPFNIL